VEVERTVRSAVRHSRMVRAVRIAIPVMVILGFGAYLALHYSTR
jgi:hypothetical protein